MFNSIINNSETWKIYQNVTEIQSPNIEFLKIFLQTKFKKKNASIHLLSIDSV